jgi:hypothetical protein
MIMKQHFKLALAGIFLALALPVMSQDTDEHLKPSDYTGNNSYENLLCWGQKVRPSFSENYEIQCLYNRQSQKFRLELMVENQEKPHVLDIDEELAYQLRTLFDVAVYSATNLPTKESIQFKLDMLKADKDRIMINSMGLDGTTYYFYNTSYGACCWSPSNGNNAGLVAIGGVIYDAIGYNDIEKIRAKLPQIKSLTKSYASLFQEPYREYYLLRIDKMYRNWWEDF